MSGGAEQLGHIKFRCVTFCGTLQVNAKRIDEALKGRACSTTAYEDVISRITYDADNTVRFCPDTLSSNINCIHPLPTTAYDAYSDIPSCSA